MRNRFDTLIYSLWCMQTRRKAIVMLSNQERFLEHVGSQQKEAAEALCDLIDELGGFLLTEQDITQLLQTLIAVAAKFGVGRSDIPCFIPDSLIGKIRLEIAISQSWGQSIYIGASRTIANVMKAKGFVNGRFRLGTIELVKVNPLKVLAEAKNLGWHKQSVLVGFPLGAEFEIFRGKEIPRPYTKPHILLKRESLHVGKLIAMGALLLINLAISLRSGTYFWSIIFMTGVLYLAYKKPWARLIIVLLGIITLIVFTWR